jgi:hypothetical protein
MVGLVLLLIAAGVAAVGAWLAWPRVGPATTPEGSVRRTPTAALAEETLDRFERFRVGPAGSTLALGDAELASVLRFALPGILPPGVSDPDVRIAGTQVTLSARVATIAFPELPSLDPVIGMLPDTVHVQLEGALAQFGKQSLAFHVAHLEAAEIPLPPAGIDSVYVELDSLVLVGGR